MNQNNPNHAQQYQSGNGQNGAQRPAQPQGGYNGAQRPAQPQSGYNGAQRPAQPQGGYNGMQRPAQPQGGYNGAQRPAQPQGGYNGMQRPAQAQPPKKMNTTTMVVIIVVAVIFAAVISIVLLGAFGVIGDKRETITTTEYSSTSSTTEMSTTKKENEKTTKAVTKATTKAVVRPTEDPNVLNYNMYIDEGNEIAYTLFEWSALNGEFDGYQVAYGISANEYLGQDAKWCETYDVGPGTTSHRYNLDYASDSGIDMARVRTFYYEDGNCIYGEWSDIIYLDYNNKIYL